MGMVTDVLLDELTNGPDQHWWTIWKPLVHEAIAVRSMQLLDLSAACVQPGWDRLDDPKARAKMLKRDAALWERCAHLLVASRQRVEALNTVLAKHGLPKLGKVALRKSIFDIVPIMTRRPISERAFAENPFPTVWRLVANRLAGNLYRDHAHGATDPEWLLLNKLLIAAFFDSCALPEARHVRQVLHETHPKLLSIRGAFIRIPEVVSEQGIDDKPIRFCSRIGGVSLRHETYSSLLRATAEESRETANGRGLLHQIIDVHDTSDVSPEQWGPVTESQLIRGRDVSFRLYEDTMLSYLGLASIEQLMRAWAAHCGVIHLKPNGVPEGILHWLSGLHCSANLENSLRELYDSHRSNLRNRIMHGNLLEIEGKSLQVRLPIADAVRYKDISDTDPMIPGNIAQLCLECLEAIDGEIAGAVTLGPHDLDWTRSISLDPTEIEFGLRLHVDFLDDPSIRQAWMRTLSDYLNAVLPGLKQLFTIGFIGWAQRPFTESLPRFMALGLTFESLFRLTVHLVGESVLQVSIPRARPCLKCQYKMLDARTTGICTTRILDRLVEHVEEEGRPLARRTLQLAIKTRNAFAHGGIADFSSNAADGIGHLFVKATQTLVTCGLHHLTSERAYYAWENARRRRHGYHLEDWRNAEAETCRAVAAAARS